MPTVAVVLAAAISSFIWIEMELLQCAVLLIPHSSAAFGPFTVLCDHLCPASELLHRPREKTHSLQVFPLHASLLPRQPIIHSLSVWICRFWMIHVDGIPGRVAYCVSVAERSPSAAGPRHSTSRPSAAGPRHSTGPSLRGWSPSQHGAVSYSVGTGGLWDLHPVSRPRAWAVSSPPCGACPAC